MANDCFELTWLLDCLRRIGHSQTISPPRLPLNSDRLADLVQQHGIAPLLYWQLHNTAGAAAELPQLMSQLVVPFKLSLHRNFLLAGTLVKLLAALKVAGIPAIAFKGPALAAQLYGNLGLRQVSDIDILVAPSNVAAAQAVLTAQDYEPVEWLTKRQTELRQRTNYERAWQQRRNGVNVDLHWGLAPPYLMAPIAIAELIARAQPIALAGVNVLVPAPADLLFILCLNGSKDGWPQLQRVCDVTACLQRHPKLDWHRLFTLVEQAASWRLIGLGLYLAQVLLGATLPESVTERLAGDQRLQHLGHSVGQRLTSSANDGFSLAQQAYFPWQLQDNLARRWRYGAGLLLPLNERDLAFAARLFGTPASLPKPLYPLYHPLRWLRLALKYGCHWEAL